MGYVKEFNLYSIRVVTAEESVRLSSDLKKLGYVPLSVDIVKRHGPVLFYIQKGRNQVTWSDAFDQCDGSHLCQTEEEFLRIAGKKQDAQLTFGF